MSSNTVSLKPLIAAKIADNALKSGDCTSEGRSMILAYLILLHGFLTDANQYS